ncbi:AraC family transcriptional regulator [Bermanella sp. R86510]|uniref:AraC family transcriptional regulator n=1 Tax=unclassified Bermanella TaxID=2627862 RepID=UPI0037C7EE55
MEHLGFASSGAVLQYIKTASDYGLDPKKALLDNQINTDLLNHNLKRISGEAFQSLLAYLIDFTNDPCFGLKSARYVQPGSYSVLGYMLMNCKSLHEALEKTPTYERLVGDMGVSEINKLENGDTEMRWNCNYPNSKVRPHMIANVLGSWVNFARFLVDKPQGKPKKVLFEFPMPDATSLRLFQAMFNCPISFEQNHSALIIDDNLLALPMRQPDQQLLKTLENHAAILMADINDKQPLPMQTKNVIRGLLLEGIPRKEMVSKRLGLTERTLQRKLQQFDSSYQQLLDEVREEQAKELLLNSELSIQDIALRLGFSEPRSFHRSFKSWSGLTPGAYRQTSLTKKPG